MVVGDDAQSIYAWRGANFQNILKFPERYPGADLQDRNQLPQHAGNSDRGQRRHRRERPSIRQGTRARAQIRHETRGGACQDAGQQAAFVAQRALELRDEGIALNNMAVLYRSHFHALELQLELTRRNIPFSITSGIRFFEQAHIKDVTAYLKLVTNPRDELSSSDSCCCCPAWAAKARINCGRRFKVAADVRRLILKSNRKIRNPT
jgi:DNA helicase II / ATP-dependent DNA helicase PcrA